jgi:hypothetical protein
MVVLSVGFGVRKLHRGNYLPAIIYPNGREQY